MQNQTENTWETNIIKLFESPKNNKCEFSSKEDRFYRKFTTTTPGSKTAKRRITSIKYVYYNGILTMLKDLFYSDYDYKKSLRKSGNDQNRRRRRRKNKTKSHYVNRSLQIVDEYSSSSSSSSSRSGGGGGGTSSEDSDDNENEKYGCDKRTSGLRHGKIVDSQLRKISNIEWKYHEENDEKITNRMMNSIGGRGPDPTTVKIIEYYDKCGWKSVYSQFVVYCDEMKLATAIDAICMDSEYRLILIEIKTGYENYMLKSSGNMDRRSPMHEIPNCPLNQHYLQLLLAKLMIEKLWKVKVYSSYVIQAVGTQTPIAHKLPEWLITRENDIWNYISGKRFARISPPSYSSSSSAGKKKRLANK